MIILPLPCAAFLSAGSSFKCSPGVYLGIAPIVALSSGGVCFGPTLPLDKVPLPGASSERGVECTCDQATVLERLTTRWQRRLEGVQTTTEISSASDGRPALYDAQKASWETHSIR